MDDYQLQTKLNDREKRAVARQSEKYILEAEIENQKRKIFRRVNKIATASGLVILIYAIISLLIEGSFDYFFFITFGIAYSAEIIWLFYTLRKQRRKLDDWKILAAEMENQDYDNQ